MPRYASALFIGLGLMAAFWAYLIIDSLSYEFAHRIPLIDLGAIFFLGLICGGVTVAALFLRGRKT